MGVSGLLPALKSIQSETTLEKYRGKCLAIDTYAWLHKASFCCAEDLVLERPTKAYISYFKKKLDMLRYFQITPYFVFDGDYLPSKAGTEKEREKRRDEYKQLAAEAKRNGNAKLAFNYYQKACDISPEMAKSLINELKVQRIKYVVAPYEADSQMVFLEKLGLVDGIISEDSDLLVFGSQVLITKLKETGSCIEIRRDNLKNCKGSHISSFNDEQLLLMATISGCDYTKGIPGIGIQKAIQLIKTYKTIDRILMSIRVEGKSIPIDFENEFKRAKIAFRHQVVFNPIDEKPQHLNALTEQIINTYSKEFIQSSTGFILDTEIHKKIATGELDPFTKKVLVTWEHKINPNLAMRSASMPLIAATKNVSSLPLRTRNHTEIPIKHTFTSEVLSKKRKSTIAINQFAQFVQKKKEKTNQLSPVSKRQRLLNSEIDGQPTISKFFSNKNCDEIPLPIKKLDVDIKPTEFTASSSDVEDITEDDINEVNEKLSQSIKLKNSTMVGQDSDIELSDDDDNENDDNENGVERPVMTDDFDHSKLVSTSESDFEENINSSEISESTITFGDRTINRNTPFTLMRADSSISVSTEPGDMNTDCFLDEDSSLKDNTQYNIDTSEGNNLIDKSNLLAEIYSFNPTGSHCSTSSMDKENNLQSKRSQFSPDKWMSNLQRNSTTQTLNPLMNPVRNNHGKVHRPSPLQQRVPLQDVKVNVNVNRKMSNSNHSKTNAGNTSGRLSSLSTFRYQSE